jgi:hypothetical protein
MQMLSFGHPQHIDVGEHGPSIYKIMRKLGMSRLWEALSGADEVNQVVTRNIFTKVYLSWLGIGEQFELATMTQGVLPSTLVACIGRVCSHLLSVNRSIRRHTKA